jgi:hypothetical protein
MGWDAGEWVPNSGEKYEYCISYIHVCGPKPGSWDVALGERDVFGRQCSRLVVTACGITAGMIHTLKLRLSYRETSSPPPPFPTNEKKGYAVATP